MKPQLRIFFSKRGAWLLLALAAALLWWAVAPCLVRRELSVRLSGLRGTSGWALSWTQKGRTQAHGVWVDLSSIKQTVLEIEPSGKATSPGAPFEFWLYGVTSDEGVAPDLKAAIAAESKDVSEGWIPFQQGPGIVYVANKPGMLRLHIPCHTATLNYARTDRGGPVTVRCRGQTKTIDAFATATVGEVLTIPNEFLLPESAELREELPVYAIGDLVLSWRGVESQIAADSPVIRLTLFGKTLFERPAELVPAGDVVRMPDQRWKAEGPAPSLRCVADLRLGASVYLIGSIAAFLCLGGVWLAYRWLVARVPAILRNPAAAVIAVAAIVVVVNLGMAWKAPLFVTPDGLDYIDSAHGLATTGTFKRFPDYKAPGLGVLLAGAMLVWDDALDGFGWFQAVLGIVSALMAYWLVRSRAPRGWALLASLAVGIHPTLLTYSCYLLREGPSAAVVLATALTMVKLTDRLAERGRGGWTLTLLLGALCAAGAYLRENMQMLLLFVPVTLLVSPWSLRLRARMARALTVALVAGALLLPRVAHIYRVWGTVGVVCPKAQVNRALSAWNNELSDGNDTAFFNEQQWESLRKAQAPERISDYDFIARMVGGEGAQHRAGLDKPVLPGQARRWVDTEAESKLWVNETLARAPLDAAWSCVIAFVNQVGLWNIHTNVASNNEWYARPLRGEVFPFTTNFIFDASEGNWPERLQSERDRLRPIMDRSRRSTDGMAGNPTLRLFNEWFLAFRALRPFFAALFLAGIVLALRRRDLALVGAAGIGLLSMLAAAIVVATPTDRFGVPFIPLIVCMAVYTLATWRGQAAGPPIGR